MVRIHLGVLTYDDSTDAGTEFGPQLRNGRHSLSRSCWPCQATGSAVLRLARCFHSPCWGIFFTARQPKPWYRKDRDAWFVAVAGTRHNLCPDKKQAMERFDALMR